MPLTLTFALTLLAGFATGLLSGMFGIGGAVVSTPAIRAVGATPLQSVGSTLPATLPSAIAGALRYRREGYVYVPAIGWTAVTGSLASVGGAVLSGAIPGNGHLLMILTAGLVGWTALRMARSPAPPDPADAEVTTDLPEDDPDVGSRAGAGVEVSAIPITSNRADTADLPEARTEWWRLALTGVAAGGLSGLLGVGGGIIMVPAFHRWIRMPLKTALGTSLTCVGVFAVPGTITHQIEGHIDWVFALPLCIGVIPGARLGSRLAIRTSEERLRVVVAIALGAMAALYGALEIAALA